MQIRTGQLRPAPPFDFAKSLSFIRGLSAARSEQGASQTLTRAVTTGVAAVGFQLESGGTVEEPLVDYTLYSEGHLDGEHAQVVLDRIGLYLSLYDDLEPFYEIGREDPPFAPLIERLYGYHQVKFLSPFECACWAVLTQRNALPEASKMKAAMARKYGARIEVDGTTYWGFPEPGRVASVDPAELGALAQNERKGEYLRALGNAFAEVSTEFLMSAPYEQVDGWLRGIKGVGEWSATFIILRGLGRTERVPFSEWRLVEAANAVYGRGRKLSRHELEGLAERYGQWQGYWAHYLRAAGVVG